MTTIFIARQPILYLDRQTFGYELLHRDGRVGDVAATAEQRDLATRAVIERAFVHWGMERLVGNRFGFINADPQHIADGLHTALPPESIIFELERHAGLPVELIEPIARARGEGYHFALDNVTDVSQLVASSLLPFVSMVKVDIGRTGIDAAERITQFVRAVQPGVYLIAERVARQDQFELAADIGFDLFQGYFFAEPQVLEKASRPANAAATVALLAEIQRDDASIERVEELVGSDASLAYRVLAVVNSSAFGLDRQVDSLRHAVVLLGLQQVRFLATLLTLSSSPGTDPELVILGATRARLASSIVPDRALRSSAFTVGLLSVTDAMFHTPMTELLDELPLSPHIREALTDGTGVLGAVLDVVRACERADVAALLRFAPDGLDQINEAYADSAQWADDLVRQMSGEAPRPVAAGAFAPPVGAPRRRLVPRRGS